MIEKITVSALLGDNEKKKIYDIIGNSNWIRNSSNCISATFTNKYNIQQISLITPDKHFGKNNQVYKYTLFTVTYLFNENIQSYSQYIYNSIKKVFPLTRDINYKIQYIKYKIKINNIYYQDYYNLLKSGFIMNNRGMKRTITTRNIQWQNEDTKILAYMDNELYIKISLDKGRIHFIVRKYGFNGRAVKELLTPKKSMLLQKLIIDDYLTAISGSGNYYTLSEAIKIISNSKFSTKKKFRLMEFITEISKYNDIEVFLSSIENGLVPIIRNRKAAMDYIRDLNKIGVNPLTLYDSFSINMIPNLTNLINES